MLSRIDELVPEYERSIELIDELILRLREEYINGNKNAQLKRRLHGLITMRNECIGICQKLKDYYILPEQLALEKKYKEINKNEWFNYWIKRIRH